MIWYDDFDGPEKLYSESQGGLDDRVSFGNQGHSMLCLYQKGSRGVGNRKVFLATAQPVKLSARGSRLTTSTGGST